MHNYLRILVLAFSLYIMLEPALGQDPNDVTQEDADTTTFWDMDPLNIERETQQKTDVTSAKSIEASDSDPDSLAQSQPDPVAARALLRKRLLYGIGGAIPVWLILSGDEDKGVPGGKVGPPPGWPDD
tara:strand:- start:383 stop:766 length:384 start_codon:yes stop_codon:yes gene_type:complete